MEGNRIIPIPIQERCRAKGDVTYFTYQNRDRITETQMLLFLDKDWRTTWSKNPNIPHHTYIDMQRIIRDAYRTERVSGKYKRDCCTEEVEKIQTEKELVSCIYELHY